MRKYFLLAGSLFAFRLAFGLEPVPPSYTSLKKTTSGYLLRIEDAPTPEGGSYIQYQILNKKKILKSFPISDTQFDAHATNGQVHGEKISIESCQTNLKDLEVELRKLKFKKVKVNLDQCSKNRRDAVS